MMKAYKPENDYILSVIDSSGYDDIERKTPEEKLKFCYETFMAEYGWRVKQAGMLVALTDWLSGLPSSCNVEFKNHAIIELAQSWGRLPKNASDTRIDNYLEKWFRFMAMRIISLWHKNAIA